MFKLITATVAAGLFSVAAYAAQEATMQRSIPQSAVTVTDWYKQNVYDPNNNKIGEVMDVLVDKSGKINTLIVGVGGFLGVDEKDVEVALNADVLTIKGEKRLESNSQQNEVCHQERIYGKFARSITLPFEPDPKMVKTLFTKGVLKITLPKSAAVKQHTVKIPVKAMN